MVKWAYFYFRAEHFPKRYKYQVQNYTFKSTEAKPLKVRVK